MYNIVIIARLFKKFICNICILKLNYREPNCSKNQFTKDSVYDDYIA